MARSSFHLVRYRLGRGMTIATILVCLMGTAPADCTASTAIEVRHYGVRHLDCLMQSMPMLASDPRAVHPAYSKILCGRPS